MPAEPRTCPASINSKVRPFPSGRRIRSPGQTDRLAKATGAPDVDRAIRFLVREERVHRRADFLALARHHVDGVVQHRVADRRGRFGHENARLRLPSH